MAGASAASSPVGVVLGRYRPLRPLGSGGYGSVWHARDEKTGRDVALKIVPRAGTAGPRAEREAAAAAQLRHPACLRAYALARDEEHVYIAYEYVPGRTLRHALQKGELDDAGAIEAAAQILDGLAHAHAHGIVHRDVKPANVLLAEGPERRPPPPVARRRAQPVGAADTGSGPPQARRRAQPVGAAEISVRLLDFGLAYIGEEETLTAAGDVPGTLAYISPERLHGRTAGPETDVWSAGVLLWEALAGRHPFGTGPFLEIARRIARGAPSLATARPDLPRGLVQLVDRALSVDPAKRPPARKLAAGLRRAASRPALPRSGMSRSQALGHVPTGHLGRLAPAVPAALVAGWTSATFPFFPAHWPLALAALAGFSSLLSARAGLAVALAVPVLPLGNVSTGLAAAYALAGCAWICLFWTRPRAALLFVLGPLLAPLGALGLVPLAVQPIGGTLRRAAQAAMTLIAAVVVAAMEQRPLPLVGGAAPPLELDGVDGPLAAASALWGGLWSSHGLALEALTFAGAAAAVGLARGRGPWPAAVFGAGFLAAAALAAPQAAALPLVGAAWLTALALALEPGHRREPASFSRLLRRIPVRRSPLRAVGES